MKKSFLLYIEDGGFLEDLDDHQAATLFKAIFAYNKGEGVPEMDAVTKVVFGAFRRHFDKDMQSYVEMCERNAKNRSVTKSTTRHDSSRPVTSGDQSGLDIDIDIDSDIDRDIDIDSKKHKKRTRMTLTVEEEKQLITDRRIPAVVAVVLDEWCEYKDERREPYTPTGFKQLLSRVTSMISEVGEQATAEGIRNSMASGYKGIYVSKQRASPKTEDRLAFIDRMTADFADNPFV